MDSFITQNWFIINQINSADIFKLLYSKDKLHKDKYSMHFAYGFIVLKIIFCKIYLHSEQLQFLARNYLEVRANKSLNIGFCISGTTLSENKTTII